MEEELVVLRTFGNELDALLAKSILEANQIPSIVSGDTAGVMEPQLQFARGTRLSVRRADVDAARELLEEE